MVMVVPYCMQPEPASKGFFFWKHVAKPDVDTKFCLCLLQILPETLQVMGRIAHVQVWDYLDKLRSSTSRVCAWVTCFEHHIK